ncbi:MAG: hypothetical protein JNK59_10950, partial [Sterolibacteriaceae bacterium]|nr:hypothetical protein [Sterolibacteriaceae bacterium]
MKTKFQRRGTPATSASGAAAGATTTLLRAAELRTLEQLHATANPSLMERAGRAA